MKKAFVTMGGGYVLNQPTSSARGRGSGPPVCPGCIHCRPEPVPRAVQVDPRVQEEIRRQRERAALEARIASWVKPILEER